MHESFDLSDCSGCPLLRKDLRYCIAIQSAIMIMRRAGEWIGIDAQFLQGLARFALSLLPSEVEDGQNPRHVLLLARISIFASFLSVCPDSHSNRLETFCHKCPFSHLPNAPSSLEETQYPSISHHLVPPLLLLRKSLE
jgi:hypothetical protein